MYQISVEVAENVLKAAYTEVKSSICHRDSKTICKEQRDEHKTLQKTPHAVGGWVNQYLNN